MNFTSLTKAKVFVALSGMLPTILMMGFLITSWETVIFYQDYIDDQYNAFPKGSFLERLIGSLLFTSFSFLSLSVLTFKKWGLTLTIKALSISLLVSIFFFVVACSEKLGSLSEKISQIRNQESWIEKKQEFLYQWQALYGPTFQSFLQVTALALAIYFLSRKETKALFT